jgi:hypothetical protein
VTVLKPHPYDPQHSLLRVVATAPNMFGVINDNIYRLLALPQIEAVLTVNSGVAVEARYFGKRVHTLLPHAISLAWFGDARPEASRHRRFRADAGFWRMVLAPWAGVSAPDGSACRRSQTGCASRSTASGTTSRSTLTASHANPSPLRLARPPDTSRRSPYSQNITVRSR